MIPTGGCSLANLRAGEDPAGTATPFDALILLQVPPPWPRIALKDPRVPQGVREALAAAVGRGLRAHALLVGGGPPAPPQGSLRVLAWRRRPAGRSGDAYAGAAAVVPEERVVDAVCAGLEGDPLPGDAEPLAAREMLVCTHGERDDCCGRFGEVAYHALEAQAPADTRVWRVSHTGGHRFAPTLVELPDGRLWGRLSPEALEALVRRDTEAAALRASYRGWSALGAEAQAAERDAFLAHGWAWRDATMAVTEEAHEGDTRVVRLEARWPDGGAWHGRARVTRLADAGPVVPASCGAEPKARPLLRVVWEVGLDADGRPTARTP